MKWIILFANCIIFQLQAQDISLIINEKSIHVNGEILSFKYTVLNKTSDTVVFYNLNHLDFGRADLKDSKLKKTIPRLLIDIFIKDNELPNTLRFQTGPMHLTENSEINKYYIIQPNENLEFDASINTWPLDLKYDLNFGEYKFQLRYYSNDFYYKYFVEEKKTDKRLKNGIYFKGIIRSNICSFCK